MKASYKMRKAIEKIERQYGNLDKHYGVEVDIRVRTGRGFYDYCELSSPLLYGGTRFIVVAHDGTVTRF